METAQEIAERVVNRLLDGDVHESAPVRPARMREASLPLSTRARLDEITGNGNSTTPPKAWHTGTIPDKRSPQGARSAGGGSVPKAWHQGKIPHKTSPQGARSAGGGSVPKAWKPGWETDNGEEVAKSPGSVNYGESLVSRVLENIKRKKAIKGMGRANVPSIAKAPGKVRFGKR